MPADGTQHAREVLQVVRLGSDKQRNNYNLLHMYVVYTAIVYKENNLSFYTPLVLQIVYTW